MEKNHRPVIPAGEHEGRLSAFAEQANRTIKVVLVMLVMGTDTVLKTKF